LRGLRLSADVLKKTGCEEKQPSGNHENQISRVPRVVLPRGVFFGDILKSCVLAENEKAAYPADL
jgi:hypothetical protein